MITNGYRLLGEALAELLANVPDFAVVGQASDSESAFRLAEQTLPAIVLVDLDTSRQPERTVRQLLQLAPPPRVIILGVHADPGCAERMLALGAHGYLHKAISRQDLVLAIYQIVRSRRTVTLADSPARPPEDASGPLTEREREVLALVAKALSNRQIAIRLKIAEGTVKRHLRNIFGKLGAVSRIDAVNKAGASLAEACDTSPVPRQAPPGTVTPGTLPSARPGQETGLPSFAAAEAALAGRGCRQRRRCAFGGADGMPHPGVYVGGDGGP
jgi:DNA-binding NarL/FixJ family response regulator